MRLFVTGMDKKAAAASATRPTKFVIVLVLHQSTVKPVCNDHLYNKIPYLLFIQ